MAHQFHETGPTSQVEAGLLVLGDSRGRDRMNVALAQQDTLTPYRWRS